MDLWIYLSLASYVSRLWSCWWRKWSAVLRARSVREKPCAESWSASPLASCSQVRWDATKTAQQHDETNFVRPKNWFNFVVCLFLFLFLLIRTDGPGLMDPCEKEATDVLQSVALQDREEITEAAQVLYKELAGSIFSTPTVKLGDGSHCAPRPQATTLDLHLEQL